VNVLIFSGRRKPWITETVDAESADTGVLLYREVRQIDTIHLYQLSGFHGGGSHRHFERTCIRNVDVNVHNYTEPKARILQCDC
jgi:hypothetical protein